MDSGETKLKQLCFVAIFHMFVLHVFIQFWFCVQPLSEWEGNSAHTRASGQSGFTPAQLAP